MDLAGNGDDVVARAGAPGHGDDGADQAVQASEWPAGLAVPELHAVTGARTGDHRSPTFRALGFVSPRAIAS